MHKMEFLIRTEDKINPQVFCLNPVHKGEHMDRIVFVDDTFISPCPECGETQYLYRKNNAITKKGHFICFEPDGFEWGTNEEKHYGIIRIPNVSHEQAKEWCSSHAILLSNPTEQERKQAQIDYRPRKHNFDFEIIPSEIKENWEDMNLKSVVFELKEEDKSFIRRI